MLISASSDQSCQAWDSLSGMHLGKIECGSNVNVIRMEDSLVHAGCETSVKIYDLKSNDEVREYCVSTSPIQDIILEEKFSFCRMEDQVRVFDNRFLSRSLIDFNGNYVDISYSNGTILLAKQFEIAAVKIDDEVERYKKAIHGITRIRADNNGTLCVAANTFSILDTLSGQTKTTLINSTPINDFKFDSHKVITAGKDNTVGVWDINTGKQLYLLLGGSLQGNSHPQKPGCSEIYYDQARIIGSFGNVLKAYQFG